MSGQLQVRFDNAEGALLGLLGAVERRGFVLRSVAMTAGPADALVTLDVEPRDAGRSLDIVARQLDRLVDVHSISVSSQQSGTTA